MIKLQTEMVQQPNHYRVLIILKITGISVSGTFIDSFFFAGAGAWVAILGYLVLGSMGWRIFVLFTSLPLFIPPIIILHCCLTTDDGWIRVTEEVNDNYCGDIEEANEKGSSGHGIVVIGHQSGTENQDKSLEERQITREIANESGRSKIVGFGAVSRDTKKELHKQGSIQEIEGKVDPDRWGSIPSLNSNSLSHCSATCRDQLLPNNDVTWLWSKILRASAMNIVNVLQGFGSILLFPALLRMNNERSGRSEEECESAVQGTDFLLVALLTGGAHLMGRLIGWALMDRFRFWVVEATLAVIMIACYGAIMVDDTIVTVVAALGVANIVYSITRLNLKVMECDINFFGKNGISIASPFINISTSIGAIVGTSFAEFLNTGDAVICTFTASWFLLLAACSIQDYKN